MIISDFEKVYNANKKIDEYFIKDYGNSEDIILKNKLELLVELGELANESRCFKYWINKPVNHELVLFEYADVLVMILYFFNVFNISLEEEYPKENDLDTVNEFMYLYEQLSRFNKEYTKEIIKDVFVNTIRLGKLLNLKTDEVIDTCLKKININFERFNFND